MILNFVHYQTTINAYKFTAKTTMLNIRIFLLKLDVLAFIVVRTAIAIFKVTVCSNLVGGHFELGELGIHCGKTAISNFKLLMHSNLEGYFELGELSIHCGKTTISNFKLLMHSNLV